MILAIDTSTEVCGAALADATRLLGEVTVRRRNAHSEIIMDCISGILERSGCSSADIEAIAVAVGPGSFTGLRIGIGTAKGLAFGWNLPVIPVRTTAAAVALMPPLASSACVLMNARKEEFYLEQFEYRNGDWRSAGPVLLVRLEQLPDLLPKGPKLLLGDGCLTYRDDIQRMTENCVWLHPFDTYRSAGGVAAAGVMLNGKGGGMDAALVVPGYCNPYKGIE